MLSPMRSTEDDIYADQIKDRACTICRYVGNPEDSLWCKECVERDKAFWENGVEFRENLDRLIDLIRQS